MRKFIVVGGFLVLTSFCLGGPAYSAPKAASRGAALTMSVTQEASEEAHIADIVESYTPLTRYLSVFSSTTITSIGRDVSFRSACICPGGSASSQYALPRSHL